MIMIVELIHTLAMNSPTANLSFSLAVLAIAVLARTIG